jgi:hypothetical protein
MKRKLNLIPLALLCGMLLTGFTRPVVPKKAVNDVTVTVYLPYTGMYNEWVITFIDQNTNWYEFHTTDETFETQILGTLPAGTYTVDIQSGYFPHPFDFWMSSPNYSSHRAVGDGFTWYNVVVEEGSVLQIDEG